MHLLAGGVDVRVVLRHAAHPGQSVHHTGFLISVDRSEFEEPQGQFTVRAAPCPVDQVVHRAVHGLEVVILARLAYRAVLIEFGVDMHRGKHAVGVPVQVTRGLVKVLLGDVRGVDELVAGGSVLGARIVLQLLAHDATLRMENR
ncbi:Uncharacterised protein [Mycobacteroides abscessus subsp. massiliense]|nr:Uncharacterised protein [Mycobacteroides abscessus subsp. massiliense]